MTTRRLSKRKRAVLLVLVACALAAPFLSTPGEAGAAAKGPFPGFTGAPDEDTCRHCHDSFRLNEQGGSITIEGFPESYELGQRYTVTVTLASDSGLRWGFQATALDGRNKRGGKLLVTDKARTQKVRGYFIQDRIYIEQKKLGTFPGVRGAVAWSFDWVAPTTSRGPITLYVSGNAANDDGKTTGDLIYFATETAAAPAG